MSFLFLTGVRDARFVISAFLSLLWYSINTNNFQILSDWFLFSAAKDWIEHNGGIFANQELRSALSPPHYHLLDSVIYVPDSDVIFKQISKWMQSTENAKCAPKIFCAILTVPHRKVYKNVPNMCFCNAHSTWLQVPLAASNKNRSCVTTNFRCQGYSGGAS